MFRGGNHKLKDWWSLLGFGGGYDFLRWGFLTRFPGLAPQSPTPSRSTSLKPPPISLFQWMKEPKLFFSPTIRIHEIKKSSRIVEAWNGRFVNFVWARSSGYGCRATPPPNLRPSTSPERLVETMSVPRKRTSYKQSITLNSSSMGRAGSLTLLISFVPRSLALVALLAVVVLFCPSAGKETSHPPLHSITSYNRGEFRVESHMPTRWQRTFSLSPLLPTCLPISPLPPTFKFAAWGEKSWTDGALSYPPTFFHRRPVWSPQFYHLLLLFSIHVVFHSCEIYHCPVELKCTNMNLSSHLCE